MTDKQTAGQGADEVPEQDPLWDILDFQGRTLVRFSEVTGYSESYLRAMKSGKAKPPAEFRRKASLILGIPESHLFRPQSQEVA